jgi:hypothetical protein
MSGSLNVVAIYLDPMDGGGINASADRLVVVGGTLILGWRGSECANSYIGSAAG